MTFFKCTNSIIYNYNRNIGKTLIRQISFLNHKCYISFLWLSYKLVLTITLRDFTSLHYAQQDCIKDKLIHLHSRYGVLKSKV